MSRRPDNSRSRAILIGTTVSQGDDIPPTPGAAASVAEMKGVLTSPELCGWPKSSVTEILSTSDIAHPRKVLRKLAREAVEILLVYFVGQGIYRPGRQLFLSLTATESQDLEDTSLPYTQLRREVINSHAQLKIVILDCSYSGQVIEAIPGNPATSLTGIYDTYVLTSSDYPVEATVPEDSAAVTPFTAELVAVIKSGIHGGRADLTLDDLYDQLTDRLRKRGQPEPNRQSTGKGGQLSFTRNAAYDPTRDADPEPAPPPRPHRLLSRRRVIVAGGIVAAGGVTAATIAAQEIPDLPTRTRASPKAKSIAWRGRAVDGPTDRVYGIAFSTDGSLLAGGSADGNAWLWEVGNPRTPGRNLRQGSRVYGVAFSHDGHSLATGSADGSVQIWDLASGRSQTIIRHSSTVWEVAFSNNDEILASSSSDRTVLLSPVSHRGKDIALPHPRTAFSVTFDPDGKTLVTGCNDYNVRLWDLTTYKLSATLSGHRGAVTQTSFQPHGDQVLASGSWDHTVRLWKINTRQSFATLTGFTSTVNGVAFSPDGRRLATGSADTTIDLWDMTTRHVTSTLHNAVDVYGVAFNPKGSLLATTSHEIVWIWEV